MPAEAQDPYSPTSPGACWLPDASGPDGVRVTLRVEPAVDRFLRWRRLLTTPRPITRPFATAFDYGTLPGLVQRHVLRDRWAVDVESDTGEHYRVKAAEREQAMMYAKQVHEGVESRGVSFLHTLGNIDGVG